MGVYNPQMKMPIGCHRCGYYDLCKVSNKIIGRYNAERCPDCPLVEVKTPHGRLIDTYIVEEQLKEIEEITAMVDIELGDDPEEGEISIPLFTIRNIHKKAQSVIEAEEGE